MVTSISNALGLQSAIRDDDDDNDDYDDGSKTHQKVLMSQKGGKVHDQEVGQILNFNPSDCSHWKRGEKNVRSVFALAKLSETLAIEPTLVHDVARSSSLPKP